MKNLALIFLLFLFSISIWANEIARTRSCLELSLDPVLHDGSKPLTQFLRNIDLPAGERNCWVHEDRSGKNRIITPFYWGQSPDDFNMEYINATFEALAKARRKYQTFGRQRHELVMIMSEVRADHAEAFWPSANVCYMEGAYSFMQSDTVEAWKQVVAHEVGHCLIMELFPHYLPTNYDENDKWWDESTAEWLSSLVYPEVNREADFAQSYDLDGAPYRQPYDAFILFTSYAARFGNRATWNLIREISKQETLTDLSRFLVDNHFTAFFQDFMLAHYRSEIADIGGGVYYREADIEFNENSPINIDPSQTFFTLNLKEGRANLAMIEIPAGYKVSFIPLSLSSNVGGHIGEDTNSLKLMNQLHSFSSSCTDSKKLKILVTHVQLNELRNFRFEYIVEKNEECRCNLDNTVVDQCLVGKWAIDVNHVRNMLMARIQSQPVIIHQIVGAEEHEFFANGTGKTRFNWTAEGTSTHPTTRDVRARYDWSGTGTFKFGSKSNGSICAQQTSRQYQGLIQLSFPNGQIQTFPINSTQGSAAPLEDGEVIYQCSERRLQFSTVIEGQTWTILFNKV